MAAIVVVLGETTVGARLRILHRAIRREVPVVQFLDRFRSGVVGLLPDKKSTKRDSELACFSIVRR
jgi:hypothetical protein